MSQQSYAAAFLALEEAVAGELPDDGEQNIDEIRTRFANYKRERALVGADEAPDLRGRIVEQSAAIEIMNTRNGEMALQLGRKDDALAELQAVHDEVKRENGELRMARDAAAKALTGEARNVPPQ